jgi:hypothetical protein
VALGRRGDWEGAVRELDAALAAAPGWADALYLRAAAYVELARADVSQEALADTAGKHDYRRGAEFLAKATADFQAYLKLSPDAPDRASIEQAIGAYRVRQAEAEAAQAKIDTRVREEEERRVAEARQKRDAEVAAVKAVAGPRRAAGWALVGVGLAAGAVSGLSAYLGAKQNDKIRAGGFATQQDIADAATTGKTFNIMSIGFAVGGGALLAVGLPIILANPDPRPASPPVALRAGPSGVFLAGRFQ